MKELAPGAVVAGHRIEEFVARGGMGVVYRVTHLELQQERALKLIAPELAADEDFRTRFRREWRLAAAIDHPHALPVHDAGEADGLLYIAMRYVPGTDLKELVRRGPLEPEFAATVIAQVAGALDAAHAKGLIHRDIKPANVLIEDRDGHPHAYLTDFGLTKHLASTVQLTNEGRWVGTVDYVAPEQIEGDDVDARTDIYGLGCVAYQCLSGAVPFPRDSDVATIWAHLNQDPPSLEDPASPRVDEVVRRAMAKNPDARFPSAGDFGRSLSAAVGGGANDLPERSVAAGTAAPTKRRTRPPRRDLRRVASVGVVLAVLLAVAVMAIVLGGGGDDDTTGAKPARQELVAFQEEVGRICDDYNEDARATAKREPSYRKRLKKAANLVELRNAVVDERAYGIRSASNQSVHLAGLEAPSDDLESTRKQTVNRWRTNVSKLRAYRDRLKRAAAYDNLVEVTTRFDAKERTPIQERNDRILAGLVRLGGSSCEIEEEPATTSIPLPADPDAKSAGDSSSSTGESGGSGGSSSTSGSTTSGAATGGGATSGGATSGGATSGSATSGGATSGSGGSATATGGAETTGGGQ